MPGYAINCCRHYVRGTTPAGVSQEDRHPLCLPFIDLTQAYQPSTEIVPPVDSSTPLWYATESARGHPPIPLRHAMRGVAG